MSAARPAAEAPVPRLAPLWFVLPEPGAAPTGGTLYGFALLRALEALGEPAAAVSLSRAREEAPSAAHAVWVDSLYLSAMPELASRARGPLGLCLHYLPSLVEHGASWRPHHLRAEEHAALSAASSVLVPSVWLGSVLAELGALAKRRFVVEPGVDLFAAPAPPAPRRGPLRAVMVANVVPGKGLLPFLLALEAGLSKAPPGPPSLALAVVGALDLDPAYAAACRALVAERPLLGAAVRFAGSLPPAAAQAAVRGADVLVSASRMESYGMALAEAVALGVPVLARRGGNAAVHARKEAGGAAFDDDLSLARELLRLASSPEASDERRSLAWDARHQRTWRDAALDFVRGAEAP